MPRDASYGSLLRYCGQPRDPAGSHTTRTCPKNNNANRCVGRQEVPVVVCFAAADHSRGYCLVPRGVTPPIRAVVNSCFIKSALVPGLMLRCLSHPNLIYCTVWVCLRECCTGFVCHCRALCCACAIGECMPGVHTRSDCRREVRPGVFRRALALER